ncbi:uncharacterized protein LOC141623035 [Silene latifolia]|uniref:uncharacterized protein LOC141623035 n=1 Tax=Silene latifolia TaxID=37657 RepID=UPI003D77F8B3
MVYTKRARKRKAAINVKQQQKQGSFTSPPCYQSSEVGIPAKKPQHEKEDSNQVGVLQQCKFEQMQGAVIPVPDPKGLDKFHSSRHLDLLVGSLNYNLSVAGNSSTSIPATATAHEELDPILAHKTMAGSGSTKNADDTLPRGGNKEATNHLSSIHGEISSNCFHENSPQESASFNLTEIAEKMCNFDEVDSFGSESNLVSVGGYKVKPKYEFPLGHILSKYGDIGVNCSLTVKFRSLCMEHLCDIIQNLMDTNIVAITDDDLEEMMGHVGDLEKQNLDIEWLKERLNEISEAKRAIKVLRSSSNEKTHHAELKAEVKKRSQQLEAKKREFALKEAELQELGKEIFADKRDIVAMENGIVKVEKVISENKAKLRPFVNMESLGQGLI